MYYIIIFQDGNLWDSVSRQNPYKNEKERENSINASHGEEKVLWCAFKVFKLQVCSERNYRRFLATLEVVLYNERF